jgi:hypothetical protein
MNRMTAQFRTVPQIDADPFPQAVAAAVAAARRHPQFTGSQQRLARDLGTGYGKSSGYAGARDYVTLGTLTPFRVR